MTEKEMMTRSVPVPDREDTSQRIWRAAITLFRARGYNGTSVRTLAETVGLEAASLYHDFPSKQDVLCDIFDRTMDDFLAGLEEALGSSTSFEERVRAFVRFHVLFHVDRQDEAFISHSELRSLTGPNRRRINAKRDHYEAMLRAFLTEGVNAGAFEIPDVRLMTVAILMMCSGVSDWFADRGRLDGDTVADAYADMVFRLLTQSGGSQTTKPPGVRKGSSTSSPRAVSRSRSHPHLRTRVLGSEGR